MLRHPAVFLFLALACLILAAPSPVLAHGHERDPKTGILLVAFGSTVPEGRAALDNVDALVRQTFPNYEVRWAYSSSIVRRVLAEEQDIHVDSPSMALAKMMDEGFTHVVVQSLHTIPGEEYNALLTTALAFSGMPKGMDVVVVGDPLLSSNEDFIRVADILMSVLPAERTPDQAVVLMGHGTPHPANAMYAALQYHLWQRDPNVLVGTVEGTPTLDDVVAELKARGVTKAWLLPFMAVAGDHAMNDMAGGEEDSWLSVLTAQGIECETVLKGTAEYDAVVDVWIDHLTAALQTIEAAAPEAHAAQ